MRDLLVKLLSSILLFIIICLATYTKKIYMTLGAIAIIISIIKFIIIMLLEPDNLFETIKKFIYLFISVAMTIGLIFKSHTCFIIISIIITIDTIYEVLKFIKNVKKIF